MKSSIYAVVAILGLAGGAYAGTASEQLGLDKADAAQFSVPAVPIAAAGDRGEKPQPGHPGQQGHGGDQDHNGGQDHNGQHDLNYIFGGYTKDCRTLSFNAQSPLSVTQDRLIEEFGKNCRSFNGTVSEEHCTPVSKFHERKVTVNIGARKLEGWETERLDVCLTSPDDVTVDTSDMLYEYSVALKNDDNIFNSATVITMVPGAKKLAKPDSKDLSVAFAGTTAAGDVRLILKDERADYFKGEKMDISVTGTNIPDINPSMTIEEVLAAFVTVKVQGSFDVAPSYEIKLLDKPKAGKYVVTVLFTRRGPLSSGESASLPVVFDLK